MKKVEITNNKTGQKYGAKFDDDIKMQVWIDEQSKIKAWGRPERSYLVKLESDLPKNELPSDLLKVEDVDTKDGILHRYTFKADFTITITDITTDITDQFKMRKLKESRDIGNSALDLIGFFNSKNNKTKAELKAMFKDPKISFIIILLQTGALSIAKDEITALDNTFFTDQEKAQIILKIDTFFNSFIA